MECWAKSKGISLASRCFNYHSSEESDDHIFFGLQFGNCLMEVTPFKGWISCSLSWAIFFHLISIATTFVLSFHELNLCYLDMAIYLPDFIQGQECASYFATAECVRSLRFSFGVPTLFFPALFSVELLLLFWFLVQFSVRLLGPKNFVFYRGFALFFFFLLIYKRPSA